MRLKKLEVKAGGGINPASPVIIDFSKSNFVKLTGDNGVGKSSMLEALLMACGQLGGAKQVEKFTNKESGKIDIEFSFVGNDRLSYDVKITKSSFKLLYEGEAVGEPMTKLKELLGVPGTGALEMKNKPLKEIIKWLAAYSTKSPEEIEKRLDKIKDGIKLAVANRASANNSAKGIREYLSSEGYLDSEGELIEKVWKESEKKYATQPDINELSKKLTAAGNKSDKYVENETKTNSQKERKTQIEQQMKALQKELDQVNENIGLGEKWLKANETAKKDYDAVKKQYDNAAQDVADYNKWQDIKTKKSELDQFEDAAIKADNKEKAFIQERKELQLEILPDVKGVEIVTEDTHEDGKLKKEGFYRDGISSQQMSTTEWLETVMIMWRKNKTKIIILDEYAALGSKAEEMLNKFEKDGCYIVVGEMNRAQKELEIEYA